MTNRISTRDSLADHLAALVPALAQRSKDTDESGIAPETIESLRADGFFDIADAELRLDAGRALARACSATAWLVAEFSEGRDLARGIGATAAAGLGDAPVTIARHAAGPAILREMADGWSISGDWRAVGGIAHADWVLLLSCHDESGVPLAALARRDELLVSTYAYLGGLRGVGWHDVAARDLVLSSDRVAPLARIAGVGLGDNRLAGVVLGCAEGGYGDYVRMTKARIAGIGGSAVATFTQVQARLAESEAELRGVVHLFDSLKRDLDASSGSEAQSRVARDRAVLARRSLDAVTRLVRQMGAMGLAEVNPVQRRYRDLRALAADASFAWDRQLAQFGRRELGIVEATEPQPAAAVARI